MKIYLQTRGLAHDYAFLGDTPPDYWWAVPFYKDATSFEQPSLILECGKPQAGEWRCFISAIPSDRRDCVKTRIRYSIALSGDGGSDKDVLLKLLAAVLNIFNKNPVSEVNLLTKFLDKKVGEHADELFGVNSEQLQIQGRINDLVAGFDGLDPCPDELSKLHRQLRQLLTNTQNSPRRAVMLNFIGEEDDPSAKHLQSQVKVSDGKILILPSPVAGGQLRKYFFMEGNLPNEGISHTGQAIVAGEDRTGTFRMGSQGNNLRTEGHNSMGSSFATSDGRGGSSPIELMVAAAIILVILVGAGFYLAQD